jgi:hypothetical protein
VSINVDISLSQFEEERLAKYIEREIISQMYDRLKSGMSYIQAIVSQKIWAQFQSSFEVHNLIDGDLRYDLGLTQNEAVNVVERIAQILSEDIQVAVKREPYGATMTVSFVKYPYLEILNIPEATFTSKSGHEIEWLLWLLEKGNDILVQDYHVQYQQSSKSRSGGAFMFRSGIFRIPPQFAGTLYDNFITRAFTDIDEFVLHEMERLL